MTSKISASRFGAGLGKALAVGAVAAILTVSGQVRQAQAGGEWIGPAIVGAVIGGAIAHHAYRHHYRHPYALHHNGYKAHKKRYYRKHARRHHHYHHGPVVVLPLPFLSYGYHHHGW